MRITVTAGKTGEYSYGLNIRRANASLFLREWGTVTIDLPDGTVAHANIDKGSFSKKCPHLTDKIIREWFRVKGHIVNGFPTWPHRKPPEFELEIIDPNKGVFRLHDNRN